MIGLAALSSCGEQQGSVPVGPAIVTPTNVPDASAEPEPELVTPAPIEPAATVRAETLELTFVGDIVLGRYLTREQVESFVEMAAAEADPFAKVTAQLRADVVVGNLESPAMVALPARAPIRHRNRFAADAAHVAQLDRAGFSVLSLANNHAYDLGVDGQREGPQVLAQAGLMAIGASRDEPPLVRVETLAVEGWRVAFVAFATLHNHPGKADGPHLPLVSLTRLDGEVLPAIAAARADHDLVIVVVHWGEEYADEIRNTQRLAAHRMIDAGVDLVIGHHPHVLQAIERRAGDDRGDGLIAYSLGNFLFPRNDGGTELSAILRTRYRDAGPGQRPSLDDARIHPIYMSRRVGWHPTPAPRYQAARVRERLTTLSKARHTRLRRVDDETGSSEDLLIEL